jgi:chromosome partitioning protein
MNAEAAVRKLLVASQKSGVGKTTASVNLAAAAARAGTRVLLLDADPLSSIGMALNLAQHPQRRPLRDAGVELPGVLVRDVVPGLDVVSPYDDGCCADEDMDNLLKVLASPAFEERCGCLIVGAPPFLGANPGQLLASCDDLLIVMRAESTAHRTLPAFLELVQRNKSAARPIHLRGIVLTVPEPDADGGRWERELRGRFGSRVLANVIPYDEEVRKAQDAGRLALQAAPESLAALQYIQLCEALGLAEAAAAGERGECPLLEVAASLQAAGALTRHRATVTMVAAAAVEEVAAPAFVEESAPPALPPARSRPKIPAPKQPSRVALKPPTSASSKARVPAAGAPSAAVKSKPSRLRVARPAGPSRVVWLGVAAAAVVGVGIRFVAKLPDFVMPIVVGTLVAAGVTLVLKLMTANPDAGRGKAKRSPQNKNGALGKPATAEPHVDPRSRIAALARQIREKRQKRNA